MGKQDENIILYIYIYIYIYIWSYMRDRLHSLPTRDSENKDKRRRMT